MSVIETAARQQIIKRISTMRNEYETCIILNIQNSIEQICEAAIDYAQILHENNLDPDDYSKELEEQVCELIEEKLRNKRTVCILEDLERKLSLNEISATKVQQYFKSAPRPPIENIRNDQTFRELKEAIFRISNPNGVFRWDNEESDDELEMLGDTISTKCPITQVLMTDPLTAPCGHSFSSAILQLMGNQLEIDCPTPGCRQIIKKNELKKDRLLRKKIQQVLRQQGQD